MLHVLVLQRIFHDTGRLTTEDPFELPEPCSELAPQELAEAAEVSSTASWLHSWHGSMC